ncbi:hypothetical protein [Methanobrevibacter sp.]
MGNSSSTGNSAGILNRVKNKVGNLITNVGNVGKAFTDSKVLTIMPGLRMLGTPINTSLEKVSSTIQNTGQLVKGNITGKQFKNYINDEYKYSGLLGPMNTVKSLQQNGVKKTLQDRWKYAKEFIPIVNML